MLFIGLLLDNFVPIIVIKLDDASVKLFNASITMKIDPATKPTNALKPTSKALPIMPIILVLIIFFLF